MDNCPGCKLEKYLYITPFSHCISIECDKCGYGALLSHDEYNKIHLNLKKLRKVKTDKVKTITGKMNFTMQVYSIDHFLQDMRNNNCEILFIEKNWFSYIVTVKGKENDLEHAEWYFRNMK